MSFLEIAFECKVWLRKVWSVCVQSTSATAVYSVQSKTSNLINTIKNIQQPTAMALLNNCPAFGEQLNMATEQIGKSALWRQNLYFYLFIATAFSYPYICILYIFIFISVFYIEMPCPSPRSLFVPHLTQTHTNLLMCKILNRGYFLLAEK